MKYEITLTIKPQYYQHTSLFQFDMCFPKLIEILSGYKCSLIAELTIEHNIHYHGIVELESIQDKNKLLNKFRPFKQIGRKRVCPVQWEETWISYIKKDIENTKLIIPFPVVKDDYRIWTIGF